jgi:PAS domain S-box-containing protein
MAVVILEALLIGLLAYLRIRRRQAEAEAARLNSRISEIVANVPGIVWETRSDPTTKQRKTTFISDYVHTMLGYTPDEWMKKPPGLGFRIVADEDREQAMHDSEVVMKTGEGNVSEFRWLAKDGNFRWVENHLTPIKDNGKVVGMRGVALDITNRKTAEEQAQQAEEKEKALMSAIPDMMFLQSLNGEYLDYHATDVNDLLVPPESFLGKNMRDVLPPDLAQQFLTCFERTEEGNPPQILEYKLNLGGVERWYEARMVRTGDKVLSIVREITERVLTQLTLQESEARFRTMADTAPVMIWMSDEKKKATYVNKQFLDFTGSEFELELDKGWMRHIHPDDREPLRESVRVAYERIDRFETEFRMRRSDGEYRCVFSSGIPRFSPGGEFIGYIGTSIDITERKESESRLRKANEELRELKNQLEAENIYLQEELSKDQSFGDIVGESAAIKYVLFKIGQVAPTDSTVLITGETGTGKELVARAIHENSPRKDRPFIKVNCAALSPSLVESELFGHEKGSFTGAAGRKMGRFELANGGTLLLDEIGELQLELQAKLLRVLQDGEFERVGGTATITTNVRLIASTNRDLKRDVETGKFRQDLWYRLNVFPITTPPLRERRDDIPLLLDHFVRQFAVKLGRSIEAVSPDSMARLSSYSWPGNVRELANVIERAIINSRGRVLHIGEDLSQSPKADATDKVKTLEELEREYIRQILGDLNWRIDGPNGAARILGMNPSTLRSRIAKLDIRKPAGQTSANSA